MPKSFKVVFTIAGLQPEFGGPAQSVPALAAALARQQVSVDLITCESISGQSPPVLPARELVRIHLLAPSARSTQWLAGRNAFALCLQEQNQSGSPCVIHDHGLWLPTNHAVAGAARKLKLPRVVSPRGMLTAWALHHRGWKKRIAWWLYQRRDLESAQALHATSRDEAAALRALRLGSPIAVIPNGVELPANLSADPRPLNSGLRTLLFLGRIHPIKGLLDLVKAWAAIRPSGWRIVISGADEDNHEAEVRASCREHGVAADFSFPGPAKGDARWHLYRQGDLFVLPSHSENFGMVVAEALACGVPVIATRGTPWEELPTYQCGWWCANGAEALAATLREALACSPETLRSMGGRGRVLVEAKYSWNGAAAQMLAVYRWMLGQGEKPECIS